MVRHREDTGSAPPSAPTGTAENTDVTVVCSTIGLDPRPASTSERNSGDRGSAAGATTTPRAWRPKGSSK